MSRLGTETAFEVLARAKALEARGRDIVHLEIGEPDFETPPHIRRRAGKAIDEGWTHYTPAAGLPQARAAVARYLSRTRGAHWDPEEVIITPGGKPVLNFSVMALLNPGDEAIYPNPGFPIYESLIRFVGGKPVPIPILEENAFSLDVRELSRLFTPRTRLLILNSPANPTGGIIGPAQLEGIARLLRRWPDVTVLSDEIYSRITYGESAPSLAALPGLKGRVIVLHGLSKTYAMTGWRLGFGAAPRPMIAAMARLAANSHSCTAAFAQQALIAALEGPQEPVRRMVREFARRRKVIVAGLNAIPGFSCRMPEAAFYAFPNIRGTGLSSKELADKLLDEAGVACLPGTSFGSFGEGYLRFSFANSVANIRKGLARVAECLPK